MLFLVAIAAMIGIGLVPAAAWADGPSDEAAIVAQINAVRAGESLPGLRVDAGLQTKARSWAQTMADKGTIWHSVLSDGVTARWERLGENVGLGCAIDSLRRAFVASPHHYANLVSPDFRWIGVGVVRDPTGTLFVAEVFMQTFAAARAQAPAVTSRNPAPAPVTSPAVSKAANKAKAEPAQQAWVGPKPKAKVKSTKARRGR